MHGPEGCQLWLAIPLGGDGLETGMYFSLLEDELDRLELEP